MKFCADKCSTSRIWHRRLILNELLLRNVSADRFRKPSAWSIRVRESECQGWLKRKRQRTIKGTKSNINPKTGRASGPAQAWQTLKLQQSKVSRGWAQDEGLWKEWQAPNARPVVPSEKFNIKAALLPVVRDEAVPQDAVQPNTDSFTQRLSKATLYLDTTSSTSRILNTREGTKPYLGVFLSSYPKL